MDATPNSKLHAPQGESKKLNVPRWGEAGVQCTYQLGKL